MAENDLVYRLDEAFARLKISRSEGFRLMKRGALRSYKVGRCRFITHAEVLAFIERHQNDEEAA
ncbi:helix-turn-helix domain-containing protein [Spirillospora sp. CA-294931]|uniref:helix-turn-helix domain-containing protein n=1 Tax=Spirillospora sp. CA-294931 TaxID=3240042 RepID=UPI003D8EC7F0